MGFCGGEAGAGRAQAFPVMGVGQRSQSHQPAHACKRVIPLLCFQLQLNLHVPRGRRPPCPWWSWGYSGEELVLSPSVPATVSQLNTGPEPGGCLPRVILPPLVPAHTCRGLCPPRLLLHLGCLPTPLSLNSFPLRLRSGPRNDPRHAAICPAALLPSPPPCPLPDLLLLQGEDLWDPLSSGNLSQGCHPVPQRGSY